MIFPAYSPANPRLPSFVLDVSIAAAWILPGQYTVYAHSVQSRLAFGAATITATNGPLDLIDQLLAAENRGVQTALRTDTFLARLSAYRIYHDPEAPFRARPEILDAARAHSISVTAAASLELAMRLNLPLATEEPALLRAAPAAGVPIFTP